MRISRANLIALIAAAGFIGVICSGILSWASSLIVVPLCAGMTTKLIAATSSVSY